MQYIVQKPLPGPAGDIPAGTLVDPSSWRNLDRLIQQRYLKAVGATEATERQAPEFLSGDLRAVVEAQTVEIAELKSALGKLTNRKPGRKSCKREAQ
jgi:hypothetical protein